MAKQSPRVFYGLHFVEGVAEYDGADDRLFISNETAKKMNPSFVGKPIFVGHQQVDLENIENTADGYVVESFYNKADGKHWAKFIVVSDKAHSAIMNGWKLSNSYVVKNSTSGGKWHNVEYKSEITDGEYNHLAIVENPRYSESVILTPEQFKEYNLKKEMELSELQNSIDKKTTNDKKESRMSALKKFLEKFKTVVNEVEIEIGDEENSKKNAKKNEDDSEKEKENKKNEDEKGEEKDNEEEKKYTVGDKEMTVNEMIEELNCMSKKMNEMEDEKTKKENEEKEASEKAEKEKKENEEKEAKEKEEKMNEIKNAINKNINNDVIIQTTANKVARGSKLYGSSK